MVGDFVAIFMRFARFFAGDEVDDDDENESEDKDGGGEDEGPDFGVNLNAELIFDEREDGVGGGCGVRFGVGFGVVLGKSWIGIFGGSSGGFRAVLASDRSFGDFWSVESCWCVWSFGGRGRGGLLNGAGDDVTESGGVGWRSDES